MSGAADGPSKGRGWARSRRGATVIVAAAVAVVSVMIMVVVLSPSMSPLASVHDADGDGYVDAVDEFPDDASEWSDLDGDGVGDNADVFPDNADETSDSDSDGVGDNTDLFPQDPYRDSPMISASVSILINGVTFEILDVHPEFSWDDLNVTLSLDSGTVAWEPDSEDLDGGTPWTTYEYATHELGDIGVSMSVTDAQGDGMVSAYDSFVISPEGGNFEPGEEYYLTVEYEPTGYTFEERSFSFDLATPSTTLTDEPITNGVKITFGAVNMDIGWDQISFLISDGTNSGGWSNLTVDMLDDGLGDTQVMQTVTIGSLVVSLTIVDLSGNGKADQGDYLRLTASSFAGATTYTFTAIYEPTDGSMAECTFSG